MSKFIVVQYVPIYLYVNIFAKRQIDTRLKKLTCLMNVIVVALLALIGVRFSTSLRYIELPSELITPPVLHELANKVLKDISISCVHVHEFFFVIFFNMGFHCTVKVVNAENDILFWIKCVFQLHISFRFYFSQCPNLRFMTLDFSNAMQLHDFNDLNAFPVSLRSLTICLSEVCSTVLLAIPLTDYAIRQKKIHSWNII